ncbi:2Fe-2S iron-sulfur cluster-binding protein [Mycobacteroides abscessus]|uniref:PDR/VanB family oxidoreductase n=1 Tax=Mycobacteroides abscessus TaxID=36809 RepID=UPI000382B83A
MQILTSVISSYLKVSTLTRHKLRGRVRREGMTLILRERHIEAHDENVISLVLTAPDLSVLPPWRPGAHLDLVLPSGRQRQYSLCGDPNDRRRYRIAVRRIPDGGGGSVEIHDQLSLGAALTVKGPRNAFPFAIPGHGSPSQRLHFVAGGIGITPILPMAHLAQQLALDWTMVYTGRNRDSMPFLAEAQGFGDRVTIVTDDTAGGELPSAERLLGDTREGTAVYCCGPAPMVSALLGALRQARKVEFHYERFSAPPVINGRPFQIKLARSGGTFNVPAERTALDVIRQHRPDVMYSCQQGFCGTCKVRVLAGTVEHRDSTLLDTERQRGDMLVCVSRAKGSRLTLDL